jgi:hypothetical protein
MHATLGADDVLVLAIGVDDRDLLFVCLQASSSAVLNGTGEVSG